jgi:hypothetical protein
MAREQRVQEIMRFLDDPDTYKAEIAKRQAEIDAAAAAAATAQRPAAKAVSSRTARKNTR